MKPFNLLAPQQSAWEHDNGPMSELLPAVPIGQMMVSHTLAFDLEKSAMCLTEPILKKKVREIPNRRRCEQYKGNSCLPLNKQSAYLIKI